ncbi:MAG: hypothetical protein M1839_009084 [Geoglossum umbratile]|nr:MAG: hypothetical protein M1839_009084 [Geoglossum umbratile]
MLARFSLVESIWFGKYGISLDVGIAAQPLLNSALDEDKLDDGCVHAIKAIVLNHLVNALPFIWARLHCEIFFRQKLQKRTSRRSRSKLLTGIQILIEEELESGRRSRREGKMLIAEVSGTDDVRDELRSLVQDHLADSISLLELDYQP